LAALDAIEAEIGVSADERGLADSGAAFARRTGRSNREDVLSSVALGAMSRPKDAVRWHAGRSSR